MTKTRTFVCLETPGVFFSEESIREVESRDISDLEISPNVFRFYFFDIIETTVEGVTLKSEKINISPDYYPNARVMTVEEVKQEVPNNEILLSNMEEEGKVIKCQPGNFQRYDENVIIYKTTE